MKIGADTRRIEQDLGVGLWEVLDGGRLTREIRDLAKFRAAIGDELIVGLAQLFAALNRLDGLLIAIDLVGRPSPAMPDGRPAHDPDSLAADRSRHVLVAMCWGTYHELMQAVDALKSANLTAVLAKSNGRRKDGEALASWKIIRTAAQQWTDDLGTKARNQLAFHLGDAKTLLAGLDGWTTGDALIVSLSDSSQSRANMQADFGFALLCRGLSLTTSDFEKLTDRGIEHRNLMSNAMLVFFGVLHAKGARVPSATELRRRDSEPMGRKAKSGRRTR